MAASFDPVTVAAAIGAADILAGQDTILPPLDLTQSLPPQTPEALTDFELEDLLALEVVPASPEDAAEVDLDALSLEQLLALETGPDGTMAAAAAGIARLPIEALLDIGVGAARVEPAPETPDLTRLDPESLDDLRFGREMPAAASHYRQIAALDPDSLFDLPAGADPRMAAPGPDPSGPALSDHARAEPPRAGRLAPDRGPDAFEPDTAVAGTPIGPTPVGPTPVVPAPIALPPIESERSIVPIDADVPVVSANRPPSAQDDPFAVVRGETVTGNVLANDTDADGDPLAIAAPGIVATARGGVLELNADGSFEYRPPVAYSGTDGATYTVSDGHGGTADAQIRFTVVATGKTVLGGPGNDSLSGTAAGDTLVGLGGNDVLWGGDGEDVLDGGAGIDFLLGGGGRDRFVFEPDAGAGIDAVADFQPGRDVVDLSAYGLTGLSGLSIAGDGIGGSVITLPDGAGLSLLLVDPLALSPADFIL